MDVRETDPVRSWVNPHISPFLALMLGTCRVRIPDMARHGWPASQTKRAAHADARSGTPCRTSFVAQRSVASSSAELNRYPFLSHLPRDILVIFVSIVSSEQAFITSGQIIEPKRSCLIPEMIKVLICVRDWEHAPKRSQNETVDEQLFQNFSNLYVDKSFSSNQVQN
ncbi:hypothetical protein Ddye_007163 [Dipteronia dyeriana]|uniref:HAT C-terminal dimerisation domain-containing protein n=1 Tax=Dipteronia dyeriana TaxID=168575 RepID=A0AAD9XJG0_9ROSI|nr:hypothetical protein Ddye_007163 [Dipteronia dyeriana]